MNVQFLIARKYDGLLVWAYFRLLDCYEYVGGATVDCSIVTNMSVGLL
jgi:hypothetical protein